MVKRRKRLEKGVESLKKRRQEHLAKKKLAEEAGDEKLVEYYDKEIVKFEREIYKKEGKI